ncbi:hypothetical protein B0H10DRAFT_215083 [Mycena sp. CBHHK59/15]|nr:hypothetical protein B0H10DRAFT_215083 [Mycena sp. CBHHK59/15]
MGLITTRIIPAEVLHRMLEASGHPPPGRPVPPPHLQQHAPPVHHNFPPPPHQQHQPYPPPPPRLQQPQPVQGMMPPPSMPVPLLQQCSGTICNNLRLACNPCRHITGPAHRSSSATNAASAASTTPPQHQPSQQPPQQHAPLAHQPPSATDENQVCFDFVQHCFCLSIIRRNFFSGHESDSGTNQRASSERPSDDRTTGKCSAGLHWHRTYAKRPQRAQLLGIWET